jgi:ABC-2 type transport system permease protein
VPSVRVLPAAAAAPNGAGLLHLLRPGLAGARRRAQGGRRVARSAVLGTVGLVFWLLVFGILFRMLRYFQAAEGIGDVLAAKLLALILLAFLGILLLSNVIAALSSFFLARDLELVMAAPTDSVRLYGARLVETLAYSSWMVLLMMLPILASYAVVYRAGPLFGLVALVVIPAFFVIPAVAGSGITLLLVRLFPARQARDLLAVVALLSAGGLVLLFRLLRPEQLVRPEAFHSLVAFVAALETPGSVWLPSEWAARALMTGLGRQGTDWFPLLLLAATAAGLTVIGAWLHTRFYAHAFSRAQEGSSLRVARRRTPVLERVLRPLSPSVRAVVARDIRCFFRDTTQWSQLILLAVLVVVYVYNIRVLPLLSGQEIGFFLVNVISFLNLGLAGFVIAAIAARFLFPAISLEGRTLWLLRSSPLVLRQLIWSKYLVHVAPLLVLAVALTAGTNLVLKVGPFMMALSLLTIAAMTFAIAALALGFGALFPRFDTNNAAEVSTGFGGLLFMMTATAYLAGVIVLQAWPVYALLQARLAGGPVPPGVLGGLGAGLAGAAALSALAIAFGLGAALRGIREVEA